MRNSTATDVDLRQIYAFSGWLLRFRLTAATITIPDAASDLPPSNPIWASEWTATATAPSFSLSPS